jgi:hypothetical protein
MALPEIEIRSLPHAACVSLGSANAERATIHPLNAARRDWVGRGERGADIVPGIAPLLTPA